MTYLKAIRKPLEEERQKGAEIVFIREDRNLNEYIIYGAKCHESWEQWGASREILADNVEDIEAWIYNN